MASYVKTLKTLLATMVQPSRNQRFIEVQKEVESELKALNKNDFGVKAHIEKHLEGWRNVPVNIAVIGPSGSGKSSFINAVRGLTPEDDGAARTGETEETLEPQRYAHPNSESLVFWDLPGVGTTNCLREKYLQEKYFDRYDFYIIITCNRFKGDDLWLAQQVKKADKKFYLIRSKVDQDLRNARDDYPNSFNEEVTLKKIKDDCVKNLAEFHDPPIFIISNREKHKWDFPKAIETLYTDMPELKREAFALSLSNLSIHTHKIIATKKEFLANRARSVAMKAAIGCACPLPEIGVHLDKKALEDEEKFYRKQFGIDNKMMEEHGSTAELQIGQALTARYAASATTECVANKLKEYANADKNISLNMIKMATDAAVSYKLALATLQGILDEYAQVALQSTLKSIELKALEL